MRVGELLRPISGAMAQELLVGNYIQADETPVGVQPESVRGKNHQSLSVAIQPAEWSGGLRLPDGPGKGRAEAFPWQL
jgi:hypothetical protein